MEYRIEQLAQAGGVAVDTIRFYQGKGLLDPPRRDGRVTWYAEHHLERLRRIRDLQQRGFTLAVIRRGAAAWRCPCCGRWSRPACCCPSPTGRSPATPPRTSTSWLPASS
ncbi:MAG: MerR family transcriptional regulator [Chloroflexi bacterium]|nr:MAG: MerR family transcriptional regulator [Chloroflexota bacterium]